MCDVCNQDKRYEDQYGNVVTIFRIGRIHTMCFENTEWGGSGIIQITHCPFCGRDLNGDFVSDGDNKDN